MRAVPKGPVALALGLGVNGLTSYLFLAVAGRVLGDAGYAPLGTLWLLVFLVGPGFFFPLEQEVGRAVASRLALGVGPWPVIRRAAVATAVMIFVLGMAALALSPLIDERVFDGNYWLLATLFLSLVSFGATYLVKGVLAGTAQLDRYGRLLAVEGSLRFAIAVVLALYGVKAAGPYGLLIGLTPFAGIGVALWRGKSLRAPGPDSSWQELSASLGSLVLASILSQVLVSASPVIVKYSATASQAALAGAFVKAVVIARIPLFLFQAVQAVMLPGLARAVAQSRFADFRSFLVKVLLLVGVIGFAGTLGIVALGPTVLEWFGSKTPLARSDLALLAAGNAVYLLAMTLSQALIALRYQRGVVAGWAAGCLIFFAIVATTDGLLKSVEVGLVAGSCVACAVMAASIGLRLAHASSRPVDLVEAADPAHNIVEL